MDNKIAPFNHTSLPPLNNPPSYESFNNQDAPAVVLTGPIAFVPHQPTYQQQEPPNPEPRRIQTPPPTQYQPPRRENYRNQLVFSLILAFIFFPLAFFWIPAIMFSLQSRKFHDLGEFSLAVMYGRRAKNFNVACFITGCVLNIILIIVLSTVLTGRKESSISSSTSATTSGYQIFSDCYSNPYYSYIICNSYYRGCTYGYYYHFFYETYRYCYRCYNYEYSSYYPYY